MRRPALALLLGCLLLVAGVSALDGYDYYQTIEYAACDQETYQQDIVIHRTTGTAYNETAGGLETWHIFVGDHCQADYDDVRFTNSTGAELAYYLWPDYDSSSAQFAVRLEGADRDGVLVIHYGNSSATTTSDGDAVYILFDHFDGSALDTSKWDVVVSSHTVSGGVLRVTKPGSGTAGFIFSKMAISYPVTVQSRGRATSSSVTGPTPIGIKTKDTGWNYRAGTVYTSSEGYILMSSLGSWSKTTYKIISGLAVTTFRTFTLDWIGTSIGVAIDGTHYGYNTQNVYTADQYLVFYGGDDVGSAVEVDWALIRAYSATPPAALTFSGEQETATPPMTPIPTRPRATEPIDNVSTSLVDDLINSLGGETVPEPGNDTINWTGLISTIAGAYTSVLGPLAYTLIFSIPFLMMWITQRDMTLPGLVGALFGLFIIVRLPAEFHLVAVTFIAISIVAVVYSLVKERV